MSIEEGSLQTTEPLRELHLNGLNMNVGSLVGWAHQGMVDFDPPYQRQPVWGIRRRQQLIRSLLMGLPVGAITVNRRDHSEFRAPGHVPNVSPPFAVIDGKQRWQTLVMFRDDEFPVPRSWFPEEALSAVYEENADGAWVRYSMLAMRGRTDVDMPAIAFNEARLASVEAEAELFDLINFGGVPQGEADDDR
ncbi:hypothetical protein QFZ75_008005 [Streptomyces sp. V3I8]|uniref:DUF262 domain-containing protein n=1 Tax=Streptomyces sp. V3I8 TaxID=3042279 RepID=UPI0027845715|nr:DUF262 domain-containing protein [Streptomyces sp. V3I8]MDQ1041503.1 hypothetical protein [Streptomyces sp. V3I8]